MVSGHQVGPPRILLRQLLTKVCVLYGMVNWRIVQELQAHRRWEKAFTCHFTGIWLSKSLNAR